MAYEESDGGSDNRTLRPIPDERIGRFPERLERAIGGRSIRSFARESGLSETAIRKYLNAQSLPTIDRVVAMAKAAGVRPEWLTTGEEPAHAGDSSFTPAAAALDLELLNNAIGTVEEGLAVTGRTMRSDKKAELVAAVYDLFTETEGKIDRGTILRLVKSAS